MKSFAAIASLSLSLLPAVLGHGHMSHITIDGTDYVGPNPNQQIDSAIRMINSVDPVKDLTAADLSCGQGAANLTATKSAAAKPGSTVEFNWISGEPPTFWPHNVGPLMTYIASCNGPCSSFQSLNAKWVKIDEAGRPNNATTGNWTQALTFFAGKPYPMKLPSDLPTGEYLLRGEIIALHNAVDVGGAEFYPSCTQLNVTGGPSSALSIPASQEASFPGSYSPTDPGIHVDVYSGSLNYQFPGPALFTSVAGGSSSTGGTSSESDTTTAAALTTTTPKLSATPASALASTTSSSAEADCTGDGSAGNGTSNAASSGAGADAVTITETVTVTPTAASSSARKTMTKMVTVTAVAAAASPVANATTTLAAKSSSVLYPRKRSRIMGRKHF